MEQMKETLKQFDERIKKENATEKYNERMKRRLYKSDHKGSPGNTYKSHRKTPQIRKPSTKINKGEKFEKLSKFDRKISKRGY